MGLETVQDDRRAGTIEKLVGAKSEAPPSFDFGARESRRQRRRGGGVWGGGVPLPTGGGVWGGGYAPSPENFFDFGAQNSYFWCILGAIF